MGKALQISELREGMRVRLDGITGSIVRLHSEPGNWSYRCQLDSPLTAGSPLEYYTDATNVVFLDTAASLTLSHRGTHVSAYPE